MTFQPAFSRQTRTRNLERLRRESFGVLVLGGGINGAGIARDLALRGVKVALVEQRHFASGTSGKNSQLIHGGLRYLKFLQFHLVRESLRERATLLKLAPHLVTPQPFLMPMYGWPARIFYGTGLSMYDLLAGKDNVGRHRVLSSAEVGKLEPGLARQGLTHGAIFYDCQIHSARFVLENIWDASRHGAVVVNYARADHRDGGVRITDQLSGESFPLQAAKLVDATGAWASGEDLRLVRGSHLVIPRVNASDNAIAYFEESGRIIFVIPWGGARQLSLVGTTDVDHSNGPDNVRISAEETAYLLQIVRRLFPAARDTTPISTFSSLRPLIRTGAASATAASREHRIWMAPDGVVHVAGGKYTTYRAMSEEAADLISPAPSATAEKPLGGNTKQQIDTLLASAAEIAVRYLLTAQEVEHLIRNYGVQAPNLLAYLPQSAPPALTRVECAQIAFAAGHEMAETLADLMFVSTYWGYELRWTRETLTPIAEELGRRLAWDSSRISAQISAFL
ncbi:MAG: glycerol-3-phosphate dehydrogenase/oxidase [Acidobacteriia bacterium]|nr:glycerol-3-phosphate dehydrogenase/oxidase [Terriglobia bacterium]